MPFSNCADTPTRTSTQPRITATKIENAQRRRAIEPEILRTVDIDLDPVNHVLEPIDSRQAGAIRISFTQLFEPCTIETDKKSAGINRMPRAGDVFRKTSGQILGK